MQHGLTAELETGSNLVPNHGGTNAAVSCELQNRNLDRKPTTPIVLEVTQQQHWEIKPAGVHREHSDHNTISYLQCASALNRCIVVITSSLNIHRTRRPGMDYVFISLFVRPTEFLAQNMATVKRATAEEVMAAMAAEKVATVKSHVEKVAVQKTATEMADTVVVGHSKRNVESAHADGTDTMLSVDNVDKNLDCSEFEELTAAEGTKEDECLVPSMKVNTFTFQW